jgi:hypothetical protein
MLEEYSDSLVSEEAEGLLSWSGNLFANLQ